MAYTAKIGGVSVNVLAGQLNVQNQIGQRSTGSIGVWSALGTVWQSGTHVQVYDELSALAYEGFTLKDKATKSGSRQGTGYLAHAIQLMDNCYRADKRRVFKTYLGVTAGYIVNDLLGSYLVAEGVTSLPGSIATGPTITEVIWSGTKSVSDALTWLATQAGYWWNIDLNRVLWFQPYGGVPAPFILDGTQVEAGVVGTISVEYGNDLYVNKQYAKGAFAEVTNQTDTFVGDGSRRTWTCRYDLSSHVTATLNGIAQDLGTKGVDNGKPFYWAVGDAVIAQDPANALLGGGDTLVVNYNGRYPVIAVAQNPALISAQKAREGAGSSGLVESTYTNTKVHTLQAAFQTAGALLAHYGQDAIILEFDTRTKGLLPGQMLTVNLSDFALTNKQMLISSVSISDQTDGFNIWFHVVAVGSPVESAQWQTYWQNLMNQSSDPSDFQDTTDTALAFLFPSTIIRTPTVTITKTATMCPIIGNSTIIGNSLIIC
jgi:hypothetical protein